MRLVPQKFRCGHDHSGRAVAALHGSFFGKGGLQRMGVLGGPHSFDGGYPTTGKLGRQQQAGEFGGSVDPYGTTAAFSGSASFLGAAQTAVFPKKVNGPHGPGNVQGGGFPVEFKCDDHCLFPHVDEG